MTAKPNHLINEHSTYMKKTKKPSKKKKIIRNISVIFLSIAFIFIVVVSVYIYNLLSKSGYVKIPITDDYSVSEGILDDEPDPEDMDSKVVNNSSPSVSYEKVPYVPQKWGSGRINIYYDSRFPIRKVEKKDPDIENYLIFGIDALTVSETKSRTDSIIIATVDAKHNSIKLTSIMRDTKVFIEGRTGPSKINAAYVFGGVGLMINTINQTFNLDIQKFAMVDMYSSESIIDSVGGVYINVNKEEINFINNSVQGSNFKFKDFSPASPYVKESGYQLLNGRQSVGYGRIRKVGSDSARTQRQRNVLTQLIIQFKSAPFSKKLAFFDKVAGSFETNITKTQMMALAFEALGNMDDIQQYRVPQTGMYTTNPVNYQLTVDLNRQIPALAEFIWGEGSNNSISLPDEAPEPTVTPTDEPISIESESDISDQSSDTLSIESSSSTSESNSSSVLTSSILSSSSTSSSVISAESSSTSLSSST